jgi:hypothetical protein
MYASQQFLRNSNNSSKTLIPFPASRKLLRKADATPGFVNEPANNYSAKVHSPMMNLKQ